MATHIVRHCVLGVLRNKTRIIVTEHKRLLALADQVMCVENGSVTVTSQEIGEDTEEEVSDSVAVSSDENSPPKDNDQSILDEVCILLTRHQSSFC